MAWVAGTAQAQEQRSGSRFGVGAALSNSVLLLLDEDIFQLPTSSILFPIQAGGLRLEPEVGVLRTASSSSDDFGSSSFSVTLLSVGVGVHKLFGSDSFRGYVGPRIGIQRYSSHSSFSGGGSTSEDGDTRLDWFAGGVLGGEHLFTRHLSLGAEGRLTYVRIGRTKDDDDPAPTDDYSASLIMTTGSVIVRVYF